MPQPPRRGATYIQSHTTLTLALEEEEMLAIGERLMVCCCAATRELRVGDGGRVESFPPVASCEVGLGAAGVGALCSVLATLLGRKGFSRVASIL